MAWMVQVSLGRARMLRWRTLRISGFRTEYEESERKAADRAAVNLTRLFGDRLVFRVIHRNPKRGAFYPAPRAAKGINP